MMFQKTSVAVHTYTSRWGSYFYLSFTSERTPILQTTLIVVLVGYHLSSLISDMHHRLQRYRKEDVIRFMKRGVVLCGGDIERGRGRPQGILEGGSILTQ